MRGQDRPVGAAVARAVQRAAGEHAQLLARGRRRAFEDVEAADCAAAAVGGAGQGGDARVVAGAAVVQRGAGDVAQAAAAGLQPRLPLLLVAVELAALVKRPDALQRGTAHRHVRAPRVVAVAVLRAEVEMGDRRILAAAEGQRMVVEAGEDRAGEDADLGGLGGVGDDQRREPAGVDLDVVVDVGQQRRGRLARARVPGGVEPARAVVGDVARAVALGDRARLGARARHRRRGPRRRARGPGARSTQARRRGRRGAQRWGG